MNPSKTKRITLTMSEADADLMLFLMAESAKGAFLLEAALSSLGDDAPEGTEHIFRGYENIKHLLKDLAHAVREGGGDITDEQREERHALIDKLASENQSAVRDLMEWAQKRASEKGGTDEDRADSLLRRFTDGNSDPTVH